jgi:hypothetical protein
VGERFWPNDKTGVDARTLESLGEIPAEGIDDYIF